MKKLLLFSCLIITTTVLHAQDFKLWTWSEYKVKFKTLDNFILTANNSREFKAYNSCINFEIYPRRGETQSYTGMKSTITRWASQNNLNYDGKSEPVYLENINGYRGVGLDTYSNGVPVSIFLLTDPDYPDISFYIWFSYRHTEDSNICLAILRSFTPS